MVFAFLHRGKGSRKNNLAESAALNPTGDPEPPFCQVIFARALNMDSMPRLSCPRRIAMRIRTPYLRGFRFLSYFFVILMLAASFSKAQTTTASFQGTVADATGAVLPGAQV